MVRFISKQFYGDKEDLFQTGCLALVRAEKDFDPDRGNKFSTLAYKYIRNDMIKYVKNEGKHTNISIKKAGNIEEVSSENILEYLPKLNYLEKRVFDMKRDGFTTQEISQELKINQNKVNKINQETKKKIANANKDFISKRS